MNCFNRAYIDAGCAIGAFLGIDHIDVSFRNGLFRAFVNASAACSTFIVYYMCHLYGFKMGKTILDTNLYLIP